MATRKQSAAAKRNIKKAQSAARSRKTHPHLPESADVIWDVRRPRLARVAASGSGARGPDPPAALRAGQEAEHPGRSKMGKWDLIAAPRKS